jgi:hypothetical protein
MHDLMMVAKQHWNAITSDGAALFCCDALCLEMARKSPASCAAGGLLTEVLRRLCVVVPDRRP